jgi:hypothetical protein
MYVGNNLLFTNVKMKEKFCHCFHLPHSSYMDLVDHYKESDMFNHRCGKKKNNKNHLPLSYLFWGHCDIWDADGHLMTLKRLQQYQHMCIVPSSKVLFDLEVLSCTPNTLGESGQCGVTAA